MWGGVLLEEVVGALHGDVGLPDGAGNPRQEEPVAAGLTAPLSDRSKALLGDHAAASPASPGL